MANMLLLELPQRWLGPAAAMVARPAVLRWFFTHYLRILETADAVPATPAAPGG
jgi:hypothetical protein